MAKIKASSLLDGDDPAGNTPKAPPQDPAVWDRVEEDKKRERRGEPALTDDEWNEMRADADGVVPPEPVEQLGTIPQEHPAPKTRSRKPKDDLLGSAPEKPAGGKKADAATRAAADRAEAAHEAKRAGKKASGDEVAPEPKKRGRKSKAEKSAEEPEDKDAVRRARNGNTVGVAGGQILSYVERYEKLEEEEGTIKVDKKEVLAEAKGNGFDVATIKRIVKVRKMDRDKQEEQDSLFELYMMAMDNAIANDEGVE